MYMVMMFILSCLCIRLRQWIFSTAGCLVCSRLSEAEWKAYGVVNYPFNGHEDSKGCRHDCGESAAVEMIWMMALIDSLTTTIIVVVEEGKVVPRPELPFLALPFVMSGYLRHSTKVREIHDTVPERSST